MQPTDRDIRIAFWVKQQGWKVEDAANYVDNNSNLILLESRYLLGVRFRLLWEAIKEAFRG